MKLGASHTHGRCFWLWVCGTATVALLMIAPSAAADSSSPTLPLPGGAAESIAIALHPMQRAQGLAIETRRLRTPRNVVRTPSPCGMVPPHGNHAGRKCSRATMSGD